VSDVGHTDVALKHSISGVLGEDQQTRTRDTPDLRQRF
jgi:hypothetical protein